jgi:uncharacterized protein DUF5615
MKVLIDECAPKALKVALVARGFDCTTVQEAGWSGKENGELLALADASFDVVVTIDRNLRYMGCRGRGPGNDEALAGTSPKRCPIWSGFDTACTAMIAACATLDHTANQIRLKCLNDLMRLFGVPGPTRRPNHDERVNPDDEGHTTGRNPIRKYLVAAGSARFVTPDSGRYSDPRTTS